MENRVKSFKVFLFFFCFSWSNFEKHCSNVIRDPFERNFFEICTRLGRNRDGSGFKWGEELVNQPQVASFNLRELGDGIFGISKLFQTWKGQACRHRNHFWIVMFMSNNCLEWKRGGKEKLIFIKKGME